MKYLIIFLVIPIVVGVFTLWVNFIFFICDLIGISEINTDLPIWIAISSFFILPTIYASRDNFIYFNINKKNSEYKPKKKKKSLKSEFEIAEEKKRKKENCC